MSRWAPLGDTADASYWRTARCLLANVPEEISSLSNKQSALQNARNPHERWLCGVNADGENSQEAIQ